MKKVLFATSALVASTGFASAQGIELSGFAEMGIYGGSGMETGFFTDIDVTFTMSGETDNGLTFGASVDLDESTVADTDDDDGAATPVAVNGAFGNNADDGGATIFISGNFGTVTMGDTDGALDWATKEVPTGSGSINDDEEVGAYHGMGGLDGLHDGQILRYDHSVGDFAFAVSVELDDTAAGDDVWGIGANYTFGFSGGSATIGAGYQEGGAGQEATAISVGVALDSGLSAGVIWGEGDLDRAGANDDEYVSVGVAYSFDAITVGLNWAQDTDSGVETDGFGFSAGYDLGGGASVRFGYGEYGSSDSFSLGVRMNF